MFTVEQRDALRDRVLRLAEEDDRVVAGAAVGSLAVDEGDRFSDLDLTFGIASDSAVAEVLDDWTTTLGDELGAVRLFDLERKPTIYRVFSLPDELQFDLSLIPRSLEPDALREALSASVGALLQEGVEADLPHADVVAERLAALR